MALNRPLRQSYLRLPPFNKIVVHISTRDTLLCNNYVARFQVSTVSLDQL